MHKSIQVLIAFACVVVIAVGGLWMRDRNHSIAAAEEAKAVQAEAFRRAVDAEAKERVTACKADLDARETGNIRAFVERAKGGDMMAEVEKCRTIVERGY